jgi:hypothetical protein
MLIFTMVARVTAGMLARVVKQRTYGSFGASVWLKALRTALSQISAHPPQLTLTKVTQAPPLARHGCTAGRLPAEVSWGYIVNCRHRDKGHA